MDSDKFIGEHSKEIIWVLHIFIAAWVWWEGTLMSREVPKWVIILVLGASLYVYDKLGKALIAEQNKEPKVVYKEKEEEKREKLFGSKFE